MSDIYFRRPLTRNSSRANLARICGRIMLFAVFLNGFGGLADAAESSRPAFPRQTEELFRMTNVWNLHFTFTPDQWEAMEPKGGPDGLFGGRGAPGPGGPRGPGGFGPSMFVAPAFLKTGDQDQNGKLSRDEFQALAAKWIEQWDAEKTGGLNSDQLRAGLNAALGLPNFAPGGPGRGRGPGGSPPGLNLQGAEGKRNGLASAMGIEFEYVPADLEFEGRLFKNVAVRYKGNGTFLQSRASLKRSLKVDLTKHVKGQRIAGVSTLNLHNNVTDASWMNEVLSHRLFRDAGVPAPRTAYARVYVTVPGKHEHEYFGLYSLVEDVDNNFADERWESKKGGIFKPVTRELFADLGEDWAKYNQIYDPKTDLSNREKRRVIEFSKLVTRGQDSEFESNLGDYLDLDSFARFMAVTVWLSTLDSILAVGQNYYVYLHPKNDKFQFIPWDLDHSFGQFPLIGTQEQRENLSIHHPWQGENRFLERVFKAEAFKKLYLGCFEELTKTTFTPERFYQQVDEIAAAIRPAIEAESETKLERFDKAVAGEPVNPMGMGGPPQGAQGERPGRRFGFARFGGPGGFFQPVKPIKGFVEPRARSVADQLAGRVEGQTLAQFGVGPGGGPDRGGPGGPGGPPGGFGPGAFLSGAFMNQLDANKDGLIQNAEFTQGFTKWFEAWNSDQSGVLSEEQLRAGIDRDLSPFGRGFIGGPGFGPPEGRNAPER